MNEKEQMNELKEKTLQAANQEAGNHYSKSDYRAIFEHGASFAFDHLKQNNLLLGNEYQWQKIREANPSGKVDVGSIQFPQLDQPSNLNNGQVSIEQLDEVRLLADQLETKLQALRNQEAEHDGHTWNCEILFRAVAKATDAKLLICAALLNAKNGYKRKPKTNEH